MSDQTMDGNIGFPANVTQVVEQLGADLVMLDDKGDDLPAVVGIIEKFDAVRDNARAAASERAYQFCVALSELMSGVLCEKFKEPVAIVEAVRKGFESLRTHLDALAGGGDDAAVARAAVESLFALLDIPVIPLAPPREALTVQLAAEIEAEAEVEEATVAEPVSAAPPAAVPAVPAGEMASTALPESLDDPDLYREFVFECQEHLDTIEEKILSLEDSPDDIDLINEIFRPIHSMKGGAGFLSLTDMQKLAHTTETLLDRCRKQEIQITSAVVETCLQSVDALKQMIANLSQLCETGSRDGMAVIVYGPICRRIEGLLEGREETVAVPVAAAPPVVAAAPVAKAAPARPAVKPPVPPAGPPSRVVTAEDLENEAFASTGIPASIDPEDFELYRRFIFQCNEHLENIEDQILSLEKSPDDADLLNGIFRAIHSIKGDSAFLDQKGVTTLAHETESLLDRCRKQVIRPAGRVIELSLQSVDALKQMIRNLNHVMDSADPAHPSVEADKVVFGPICEAIQYIREHPEAADAPAERDAEPPKLGDLLLESGDITEDQLDEVLDMQAAPVGEILVKRGYVDKTKVEQALERQKQAGGAGADGSAKAIKVDTDKIDMLVNLVGELVIIEAQVSQMAHQNGLAQDQVITKNLSQLGKITKELQDRSMTLRMMPIKQTFQKMTRLVRDASKKIGKKVNLVMSGEDTELDKTVVEQIGDPLVHMIRNSIDHGIEMGDERLRQGKPETGTVNLDAFYQGDQIVIRIRDDGKGLDRERIIEKAIQNGLLPAGAKPPDSEVFSLIFMPGFSTAKEITDISGRGVGMDVVRRNIEKLRGSIDVQSVAGKGTTISVSLPLTLAIIDGMVVRVGPEQYIIPTVSIQESFQPVREDISTVTGKGEMLNVRGKLIPLVRLYKMWNIPSDTTDPTKSLVVIVENSGERGCLMVDELIGQQQIVIKTLGDHFRDVRGLTGATILGNGRVGLILDVKGVLERARSADDLASAAD